MTNDYNHLRIALAEGKCVTDIHGVPCRQALKDNSLRFQYFINDSYWGDGYSIEFGPNSKVVDDPSGEKEEACAHQFEQITNKNNEITGYECVKCTKFQFKASLTYDEALNAFKSGKTIRIHYDDGAGAGACNPFNISEIDARLRFDLAERRGYRMEEVK
jgi:hypothetical protein